MENTIENRKKLVDSILRFYSSLSSVVNRISNEKLDYKPTSESWSIRNIIHHIADAQMNQYIRIKLVLTEDTPTFKTFEENDWAKLPDFESAIQPAMSLIMGLYAKWADTLVPLIRINEIWDRKGIHPVTGEIDLFAMLEAYVSHGYNHIRQIERLLDQR